MNNIMDKNITNGLLAGKKVYLSSPMECVMKDKDHKWHETRKWVKEELAARFGLLVHDPYDDHENSEDHLNQIEEAKKSRNGQKLSNIFHRTVRIDLKYVDKCDILIAYVPKGIYSVGVPHEIINANNSKKLVLLVEGEDRFNISLWYYGFIPERGMFDNWGGLFEFLKEVDGGYDFGDNRIYSLQIKDPKGWT